VIVARYILKEHIGPFFFGFAVITLVLVMDFILEVMQSIITKGVGVWEVLEIFGLNLAWMLALSVPMSVLVATLMAYGRLASDSEILALKSAGWKTSLSYAGNVIPIGDCNLPHILAGLAVTRHKGEARRDADPPAGG